MRLLSMRFMMATGLLLLALPALALDFRSVNTAAAVLVDLPSKSGKPLYVINRGYPLEVIESQGEWAKVRDSSGALAWIRLDQLGATRTVVVRTAVDAHTAPDAASPVCAHVSSGVLLPWLGNTNGRWVKVRLPNKTEGYLNLNQVWGN